jgi:cell wall-associated NlpC family hydrolase
MRRLIAIALGSVLLTLGAVLIPAPRAHASTVPAHLVAMRWARAHEGAPYVWGGTGPWGFDCSGLVYAAYKAAGITLPRDTFEMLASVANGELIPEPISQVRRGDLLFYGSGHVELATRFHDVSFGAQQPGTDVGYHTWGGAWSPTLAFRVRGAG